MSDGAATFDFSALRKLHRDMATAADDLTPTMQLIADKLVGAVHETWDTAGHGTWPALAPSTLARKGSEGALRMLFETGDAYGAVTPIAGPDFAGADGSSVDYMRFHVGDAPRQKIPRRDPFDLPDEEVTAAAGMVLDALVGGIGGRR